MHVARAPQGLPEGTTDGLPKYMSPLAKNILCNHGGRYDAVFDLVDTIIVALDATGSITMLNTAGCRLLGYEEKELLGKDWFDTILPEDQREAIREVFRGILSGKVNEYRTSVDGDVLTRDGKRRVVSWSNSVLREEDGTIVGTLSSGRDITVQRQAEEALQESSTWMTSIFSSLDDAMFILSPDRRIIDINPAGELITGYPPNEILEQSMEFLHVDLEHYQEFERRVEDAFDRNETAVFEFELKRKDGTRFPTEHSVTMLEREGGSPLGIVSVFRDISDRKQAEEDRQRVFNMSVDMLAVSGFDGIFREINPSWERTLGWSEDELKTRPWIEFVHPDDQEATQAAMDTQKHGESISNFESRYLHKDGTYRWISWNSIPDMDRRITFAVARDVTVQKHAEQALAASEERFRMLMQQAPLSMELYDPNGLLIQCNDAWSELWGVADCESMLCSYNLFNDENAQRTGLAEAMAQVLEKSEPVDIPEIELLRDHGGNQPGKLYIHSQVYPLLDATGSIQYVVVMHENITERKRLEEELKRLATTDSLTGTRNRHNFMDIAGRELTRAIRYGLPLVALMIDIDHFKNINDTYGHRTGDMVLKAMVDACHQDIRENDVFGRLGGEEFGLILTDTTPEKSLEAAERLRESLAAVEVKAGNDVVRFTVSIGLAALRDNYEGLEDLLNRADKALYEAKRAGRNRVLMADPDQDPA